MSRNFVKGSAPCHIEVVDLKGRELEEAQKIYDNNFVKQYQVDRAAEKLAAALACWD